MPATLVRSDSALVDRFHPCFGGRRPRRVPILILGPGESTLAWKSPRTVTVREFDIVAEPAIEPAPLPALTRFGATAKWVRFVTVGEQMAGLIYVNGHLPRRLEPGLHAFWPALGTVRAELVELRRQVLEVNG